MKMLKRLLLSLVAAVGCFGSTLHAQDRPNIVLVFVDDLGYGDVTSYGHPTIMTPRIDEMARQGVRLTSFYSGATVCTPSRAALLTGRYAPRTGVSRVLFPADSTGLPPSEITVAEVLKEQGYRTAAIGKWHLGHLPPYLPTAHGFDMYFGVPYSNDMDRPTHGEPPTPLIRDTVVVEQPAGQTTLTERYTEEAVRFIRESGDRPFFVYLAHTMPHVPIYASERFRGRSRADLYGDVIEEIDWSVGRVLDTLRELGHDDNTLVVFTSDNGPWVTIPERHFAEYQTRPWHGGSSGPLRGAKMSTYEGGVRVPAVFRWPGVLPEGRVSADPATALDLFTTFIRVAGGRIPGDRPIDGHDILPFLKGEAQSPTSGFFYFWDRHLEATRDGRWKLRISERPQPGYIPGEGPALELFDLEVDPGERFNVAAEHPDIVARLRERMRRFAADVGAEVPEPSGGG